MSHTIVVGSSSLVNGVLTFTMKIDPAAGPLTDFGLNFTYDAAKVPVNQMNAVTGLLEPHITVTGPAAGFFEVNNGTPGQLLMSYFNSTTIAAGTTLVTVAITLANAADTQFLTSYDGNFGNNGVNGTIPAIPLQLADQLFNSPVQGVPTIAVATTLTEDQSLSASVTGLSDGDHLGTSFTYAWMRDGVAVANSNSATYLLGDADVGAHISVRVSYTDGAGHVESATSAATAGTVANVNDAPGGTLSISGTATEGVTLSAANAITDADGLGAFSYQWSAGGTPIAGATNSSYTLTAAELGKAITVTANYTDGHGTAETVTSAATSAVSPNSAPTGAPVINGTAAQGQTLSVTDQIVDADGKSAVSFQWAANGVDISGATGTSLVLTQAQVGAVITVRGSYIDGAGKPEAVTSAGTAAVLNVNDPPVANADTASGIEDQPLTIAPATVLANDTDIDGDPLTVASVASGTGGTVALSGGNIVFTPAANFNGAASFSYTASDGNGGSSTATVSVTVSPVNDAPVANADTVAGTEDQVLTLAASALLANDTDVDGDTLSVIGVSPGTGGTVALSGGNIVFTPSANFNGAASFTYMISDGKGTATPAANVTVNVAPVNDAPVANPDSFTGNEDQAVTIATSALLGNDTDIDGNALSVASVTSVSGGTAVLSGGNVVFTPNANFNGAASFDYTISDGSGGTSTAPVSVQVQPVNDAPTGALTISGAATKGQTLTAASTLADVDGTGNFTFQWYAGGVAIAGANSTSYVLTANEVGKQVMVGVTYVDGGGTTESVTSAPTATVNLNNPPTGGVTINGNAAQGQTLSASQNLQDPDGLGPISFQWLANGIAITGATGSTLVLGEAQVGQAISVKASYVDGLSTAESVTSAATAAVANVNDPLTGNITIAGAATQGQVLTASNTFADLDGLGTVGYQWFADGTAISGATGSTLTLGQAQVNKAISVKGSYVDGHGTTEAKTSATTAKVANTNDLPTGKPTISNTAPAQGQTVTASTTSIADADGLGTFSFQWLAAGVAITGATSSSLALTQADVGKALSVQVAYTDGFGTAESILSASTSPVANVNDAPTGAVTIDGARVVGLPLQAQTSTIADLDGLGTFKYQWFNGTTAIAGATAASFSPTAAEAGKNVFVKVSYTDGQGTTETLSSAAVSVLQEDNVTPLASPTITPVAGDGNGDGIKDSTQVAVVSAPLSVIGSTSNTFVTLVADATSTGTVNTGSTAVIQTLDQEAAPASKPGKMSAPMGLIDFTATTTTGQTESFSLFVDRALGVNGYWKQDSHGTWVNLASKPFGGATTAVGNKIRLDFKITDGGEFDNDHHADGIITDPAVIGTMELSVVGYAPDVVLTASTHLFF